VEITEIRIKLMEDHQERLQAFCSITFDQMFAIRDLKIIEGAKGSFVAMPSRKLTDRCPQCGCKNHLRGAYCNQCGARLKEDRAPKDGEGRAKLYADIAHPINSRCRELIQSRVIQAYQEEVEKARQPGYVCRYDDYGEDNYATLADVELADDPRFATAPAGQTRRIDGPAQPAAPHGASPETISNGASHSRDASRDIKESDPFGLGILS
jgi:stage V sporulation protein G